MKRNLFSVSLLTAIFALGGSYALAQQNQPPAADPNNPCNEYKPEQLKQLNEEQRKKYDEEIKACKETLAKNAKIKNATEVVNRVLKEGNSAMDGKNYDVAVAKYDEGYQADPDYWGSAPVLLRNKAIALRARGVDKFNAANRNTDKAARAAGITAAGQDFQASVDALTKAVEVFNKSTVPTAPAEAKNFETNKNAVIADRVESYRLLLKADGSKADGAVPVIQEYLAIEQDSAKKQKAQLMLAQAYFASDFEKAIPEYKKVLATDPNNTDALYELGSALIGQGGINNDKAMIQEGVAYMERFVKAAPSGYDQAKLDDAKGQIELNTAKPAAASGSRRKN